MKDLFQKSLLLLILLSGLILLGGCGSSSDAPSPEAIKGLIQNDIDDVEKGVSDVESKASTATGEMAATLANNLYAFKNRIEGVADTFDNDVKDGYITEEERADYDKTIDEIKSRIDTLVTDLRVKAGDFASTISEDTTAVAATSKEELDEVIKDDDTVLTNFEAGVTGATGETLNTMRGIVTQRLATIEKDIDDLDKMVSSGIITEDEKTTYERDLKKIRRRFEELEETLGADESASAGTEES